MAPKRLHDHTFELTGGHLCLDLANTIDNRPTLHTELLPDYEALLDWSRQAGVISPKDWREHRCIAAAHPGKAASVLAKAKRLREVIFQVFSGISRRQGAARSPLEELNRMIPGILCRSRLVVSKSGYAWVPANDRSPLETILWWVSRSAMDLLISKDLETLRECAAPNCSWLFLDRSKNKTRRWCDMKTCGNRDKVRRFRMRRRTRPIRKRQD